MNENYELFTLIQMAKKNDMKATFEIILKFEPLIIKEAKLNGEFDQNCKDYIIDDLIKKIKKFKKI